MTAPWNNFGKLSTELEELLEASTFLARRDQLWSDAAMERIHVELELMFLEDAE